MLQRLKKTKKIQERLKESVSGTNAKFSMFFNDHFNAQKRILKKIFEKKITLAN